MNISELNYSAMFLSFVLMAQCGMYLLRYTKIVNFQSVLSALCLGGAFVASLIQWHPSLIENELSMRLSYIMAALSQGAFLAVLGVHRFGIHGKRKSVFVKFVLLTGLLGYGAFGHLGIFILGLVLFEMLAGFIYFKSRKQQRYVYRMLIKEIGMIVLSIGFFYYFPFLVSLSLVLFFYYRWIILSSINISTILSED